MVEYTGVIREVDGYLAGMGYDAGVRAVVRRFRERAAGLQELALRWQTIPPPEGTVSKEAAMHPGGAFYLEVGGTGIAKLVHVWPGWGRRLIKTGNLEALRSEALRILRLGGPFGGPTIARAGEHIVQVHEPQGGMRQPLPDGSETRALLLEPQMLAVRIWPDGKFAQLPADGQADPSKLIDDDAEYLLFGSTRTLWMFTDVHPLIGTMHADPYDLLLCPLRADRVVLLAVEGSELFGIKIGTWDTIRTMDTGSWIGDLEPPKAPPPDQAAGAASRPNESEKKAKTAKSASGSSEKKKRKPRSTDDAAPGDAPGDAPKRRRRVATSPGGMPGPRQRRVRVKPGLAAAITGHLSGLAASFPAGKLGAAFAAELLRALEAAALSNHPTVTGTTVEIFSRLHKKGFLSSIPADQAGRAALKLLAERTPLVRRLHYRRWSIVFGDIHDPASELRARLGSIPAE